jgi:hypothetical protein
MDSAVKKDIIQVLTQTISLIKKKDFVALREISNNIIHDASIFQDRYSTQTAVIVYALSKILERFTQKNQEIPVKVTDAINQFIENVISGNENACDFSIKNIFDEIVKLDERLPWHVQLVIEKAHIVKGSNLYRHGLSIGRVAEILGISQWDLMSYIGKTRIADKEKAPVDIKGRLNFARKLFGSQ